MLKNEEISQLMSTVVILEAIEFFTEIYPHALDNFYENSGITIEDIQKTKADLVNIIDIQKLKHVESIKRSMKWNKANPERYKQLKRESAKRSRERCREKNKLYQAEYYKKNKKRLAAYKAEQYRKKKAKEAK